MKLEIREGNGAGTSVESTGDRFVIGRDEGADFVLDDQEVSREHAILKELPGGRAELRDMGSRNGTFVNGKRISEPIVLEGGEEIKIGDTVLIATGPKGGGGETKFAARPAASPKRKRPSTAIIAAIAVGGLVIVVAVLAIAGVFSGSESKVFPAKEVAETLKPSTLQVIARDERNNIFGGGSAWVYNAADGLIVTNAHVINDGSRFQAAVDGAVLRRATVVGVAPCRDIAVLRLGSLSGLETLPRAIPSDVSQGETVYAVGFPGDSTTSFDFLKTDYAFTAGTISALGTKVREGFGESPAFGEVPSDNGSIQLSDVTQTDAAINPGNSGGPLVNDRAELVGMDTVGPGGEGIQGQGGAIGLDTIEEVVPQLAAEESIGWAGFGVAALPTPIAEELGIEGGMYITSVVEDTPADQTQLPLSGLVITTVNGQPVTTQQAYCNIAEDLSGQDVQLGLFLPESGEFARLTISFP
ncbi:MAG: trypsin-like peptidase domain-containing protein [Solirubrobacterales bacterium]